MLAVTKKNLRSLKHDRRTIAFIIVVPLLMIALFGYTFGGDIENLSVNVVNFDSGFNNSYIADWILEEISDREALNVLEIYGPEDADLQPSELSLEKVKNGEIWAAIIFENNFSRDAILALESMREGEFTLPSSIIVHLDSTNPNVASTVANELQRTIQNVFVSQLGLISPVVVTTDIVYGGDAEFIDFFAPGVMGLAAMMVTFMLSIISFVQERRNGTLDRLLSSPITEGEIVGGYALAFGLVGLMQATVIIVAAVLLFQIQIVGNPMLALLIIFLLGMGTLGIGFLLSSLARNEFQAMQFMPLIIFPSILLAGVFWPIEAIPEILRPLYFIPLTYAVEGCRSVMIRGWGIEEISFEISILIIFAAVMLILSIYALKRRG